jgi:hypothetical protein
MMNAITNWKWSLGVVARSSRTAILLAVLMGLWGFTAYELLGLPAESSVLLMVLALIWAVAQLLVASILIGGTVATAGSTATGADGQIPFRSVWMLGRKKMISALVFGLVSLVVVGIVSCAFEWADDHALEVASFLTFHLQKPVDPEFLESRFFDVIEWLLWAMVGGFLLSYLIVMSSQGWSAARKRTGELLVGAVYRAPFVSSALSLLVFGGLACKLAHWHPIVPPGFWDYTQVVVRFSVVLFLIAAGLMFWSLSLARLLLASQKAPSPK